MCIVHFYVVEQAECIVLLSSSDDDVNCIVGDVLEKNRKFNLPQTSHIVVNEDERTLYTVTYVITVLTKKVCMILLECDY